MEKELRCDSGQLLGKLQDGLVEIRCRNARCGYDKGSVVLHLFDPISGVLVSTKRYQNPNNQFNRSTKEAARCR